MNELSTEKTMTIKEVANSLNVSTELVTKKVREIMPDKMLMGKTTYLNEVEVTAISLSIKKNPHLVQSYEVKTKLEKALLIQQAMQFQQEIINEQQAEIEALKPKAIQYDTFMNNESNQRIGDVAKIFGLKPHKLFQMLRDAKILKDNYVPYSDYEHHFKTVQTPTKCGHNVFTSYVRPSGVDYISKRFKLSEGE